jgi:hypothetical protein
MNVLYVKGSLTSNSLPLSDAGVNFTTIEMRVFLKSNAHHNKYEMIIFDGYAIENEINYQDFITLRDITSKSPYTLLISISMDGDINQLKKADKIGVFTKIRSNKVMREVQTRRASVGKENEKISEDAAFWELIHSKLKSTGIKSTIIIPEKGVLFQDNNTLNNEDILDDFSKPKKIHWLVNWLLILLGILLGGVLAYGHFVWHIFDLIK